MKDIYVALIIGILILIPLVYFILDKIRTIPPSLSRIRQSETEEEYCNRIAKERKYTRKEYYNILYLRSKHWKDTRKRAIELGGGKCRLCGSKNKLQVHHNCYNRLWREEDTDLVVLCRKCHAKYHNKF